MGKRDNFLLEVETSSGSLPDTRGRVLLRLGTLSRTPGESNDISGGSSGCVLQLSSHSAFSDKAELTWSYGVLCRKVKVLK